MTKKCPIDAMDYDQLLNYLVSYLWDGGPTHNSDIAEEELRKQAKRAYYGETFDIASTKELAPRLVKTAETNRVNSLLKILSAIIHEEYGYDGVNMEKLDEARRKIKQRCARHPDPISDRTLPSDQTIDGYIDEAVKHHPKLIKR